MKLCFLVSRTKAPIRKIEAVKLTAASTTPNTLQAKNWGKTLNPETNKVKNEAALPIMK
jgi:hypothetical protein